MEYILRPAKKEEARELAFLVNLAGKSDKCQGLNLYEWTLQAKEGEDPYDVGEREFSQEEGLYSYKNIRVIDVNGKVAAMALSFQVEEYTEEGLKEVPELFHIFKKLTNKIAGGYYLDSLASHPEYRGQGFGWKMLADSCELARSKGYDAIYLIAFDENINAVKIYEKNGFYPIEQLPTPDHPEMPYGGNTVLFKKDLS